MYTEYKLYNLSSLRLSLVLLGDDTMESFCAETLKTVPNLQIGVMSFRKYDINILMPRNQVHVAMVTKKKVSFFKINNPEVHFEI